MFFKIPYVFYIYNMSHFWLASFQCSSPPVAGSYSIGQHSFRWWWLWWMETEVKCAENDFRFWNDKNEHSQNSWQSEFYFYIGYEIKIKAHVHDSMQCIYSPHI